MLLNLKYSELYYEFLQLKKNNKKYFKKFADRSIFRNYLKTKILNIYLEDPFLPDEISRRLGGEKVKILLKEIKRFMK